MLDVLVVVTFPVVSSSAVLGRDFFLHGVGSDEAGGRVTSTVSSVVTWGFRRSAASPWVSWKSPLLLDEDVLLDVVVLLLLPVLSWKVDVERTEWPEESPVKTGRELPDEDEEDVLSVKLVVWMAGEGSTSTDNFLGRLWDWPATWTS